MLKNLGALVHVPAWQGNLLRLQLWRLQDLCDGGELGFTVELFFLALKQLLSTSARSKQSHLTGRSTNTRSERNASFSTLPRQTAASSPALISLRASRMSSWYCWAAFSKDRQAHMSTMPYSSSGISIGSTIALDIENGGKRSWRLSFRLRHAHNLYSLPDSSRYSMFLVA